MAQEKVNRRLISEEIIAFWKNIWKRKWYFSAIYIYDINCKIYSNINQTVYHHYQEKNKI